MEKMSKENVLSRNNFLLNNWKWMLAFCAGFLIASVLSWFMVQICPCGWNAQELEEILEQMNNCCN